MPTNVRHSMHPLGERDTLRRFFVLFPSLFFVLALTAPSAPLGAQVRGTVSGQVVDEAGEPLPGVTVAVEGTDLGALTGPKGRYRIRGLQPGSATLEVRYLGYRSEEIPLSVEAGEIAVHDVTLEREAVEMEGIVVEAQRGMLRTLETKRQSPGIVDVVDMETLQELPFQDMAEGLDQLPAVHIQSPSAGRGFRNSFIVVRGIQPSLNSVTVMGVPLTSTTGDRAVALDVLPGSMASQLEVMKAVTPDMDGNTIGGTANIVPLSAFDRRGSYLFAAVEGAAQDEVGVLRSDEVPLNVNLAGSTRITETFGLAGTFNFKQEAFGRTFSQPDDWEVIPQPGFGADLFVPEGTRLEQSQSEFQRYSGTLSLDWRPRPEHNVRFLTSWTETEDEQISTQTEWNYADGKDNIPFELMDDGRIFSPEGENEKEMDIDRQEEELFFAVADGSFTFDPVTWTVRGSYSRGELDELVREWSFDSENFESVIDPRGRIPWAEPVDPGAFNDPRNYTFDEIDIEPNRRESEAFQVTTDLRWDTDLLGQNGFFKVGGLARPSETVADRDENQMEFNEGSGIPDITLLGLNLAFPGGSVGGLPLGPVIDPFRGPEFIEGNPNFLFFNEGASIDDQIEGDFAVDETVFAGYGMFSGEWGPVQVTGGLRVEATQTESLVKSFNENTEEITSETVDNDYTNVLPNLHLRYRVNDQLQIRGAWTHTIARAPLSQLAGSRNIDFDNSDIVEPGLVSDASVEQGNPDLDPFESINLDGTVEYYPRRGSFYMAGIFYKSIDDPIFIQSIEERNVTLGNTLFQEVDFEQPLNANSGDLLGLEAQVQETFTFLPGPLEGLGVTANLAWLDSEFEVPGREGEDLPFFQQPDLILSVTPFFHWKGLRTRLQYQYTDEYVVGFGSRPDEDEFFDSRETLDLQVSYDVAGPLGDYTVLFGAENLTDAVIREYQGAAPRTTAFERLGRFFWFGFRTRF